METTFCATEWTVDSHFPCTVDSHFPCTVPFSVHCAIPMLFEVLLVKKLKFCTEDFKYLHAKIAERNVFVGVGHFQPPNSENAWCWWGVAIPEPGANGLTKVHEFSVSTPNAYGRASYYLAILA